MRLEQIVEGLLRRLSSDSSEAQSALRVIAFFDRLVETRGGIEELIRSSARLMGASAGFIGDGGLPSWGYDSRGRSVSSVIPATASQRTVALEGAAVGVIWIVKGEGGEHMVELIMERMTLSAIVILDRAYEGVQPLSSPAEVALDRNASMEQRAAALSELRFRSEWTVRVLVTRSSLGEKGTTEYIRLWAQATGMQCAAPVFEGEFSLVIVRAEGELTTDRLPGWPFLAAFGARSSALTAFESLDTGRAAILLTSELLGPNVIDYETVGPLVHIASLTPETAATTVFVRQLNYLAQSETGLGELKALDKFCEHRSLRAASLELNLHHSSLAHRLRNVEKKLSIDLADPRTLFLITLALQLFRVASWAKR